MLLVHITDLHFGCADEHALQAAAKYIDAERPDAVICTGDLSKDGRRHELDAACAWMRTLKAPVIVTPGNHDVPYYNLWGRIIDPWKRFRRAASGLRTATWSNANWCIVPINTARGVQARMNWAQGAISNAQVEQAKAELAKAAPGALRIVITHHPLDWPNDAPIHGQTIGGASAMNRLIEAGAELFLSGHLHFASSRLIGTSALSVTSGTLSKRVRHERCAFTAIRRPAPNVVESEVLQVVQGVVQSASARQFKLSGALDGAQPLEVHAAL